MEFRHDEKMNRGLGMDILEHHIVVVFIQHLARQFMVGNFTEKTVVLHIFSPGVVWICSFLNNVYVF